MEKDRDTISWSFTCLPSFTVPLIDWHCLSSSNSCIVADRHPKEIDKQIASSVVDDDEVISTINTEIESNATAIGQFDTNLPEQSQDGET